ncbi:MAG TPA: FAD-binding oxidoreductase [Acidimicrobiales bacterium]|nr:FAD-binding oxidoreductase [Acidimicrobiales bacterium]
MTTEALGPGVPTPPIALAGPAADAGVHLSAAAVPLDDGFVDRLRSACGDVTTDAAALAEAGRDWWPLAMVWARANEVPARGAAIARPGSADEVAAVLRLCNEARVPVTASAGRSGVCGAAIPVFGGVVLDMCGMAGIVDVDDDSLLVDVLPGTFGDHFEHDLRGAHGLTVGHWPQSMALSTVGGWVACRGAGQYSNRYGKIEDIVVGLEVVLADGTVITTGGGAPRAAVGPDLNQVFVGSEGTLGIVTRARLRAHPVPTEERRGAWAFPSFEDGLEACRRILRRGATPAVLRLYDHRESKRNFDIEDRHALIVLDEGDGAIVDATMAIVAQECATGESLDASLVERWLGHRNDVSGLESAISRDVVVDTTEVAGRWAVLAALYRDAVAAVKAVEGTWVVSAHQSHAYTDGACLYFTFAGQPTESADASDYYRRAWDAVSETTLRHGGALSHHHGIGLNRSRFVAEALGAGFGTLVALKNALDPNGILNPGKLGLPSPFGPPPWP